MFWPSSSNGSIAIFSDTPHSEPGLRGECDHASAPSVTALNISERSAAAFSPDGLKAFIFGFDINGNPNLYIYSTMQALQMIPLPAADP